MEVVDHEPERWFLVKDGDALLLDARCGHGPVEYAVTLELDGEERRAHELRGHMYLNDLAESIHMSNPGARGSPSPYGRRLLKPPRSQQVTDTIMEWIRSRSST